MLRAGANTTTLVRTLVIGFILTAALLAAMLLLANQPTWWRGYVAATVVSAIAAGASLVPLIWGLRRKLDLLVGAYFAAAGTRALVSLGGCLFAIFVGGYPGAPTLLLMVCYYFVLLAIETTVVAKITWSAKG